eukprot:1289486-Prymnesium_polylepis.1
MRVGQGASGVLTAGAPRAEAQGMRASRAGRLAKGQCCAIRASFAFQKSRVSPLPISLPPPLIITTTSLNGSFVMALRAWCMQARGGTLVRWYQQ